MDKNDIKSTVNKIFTQHGLPKITKFAAEFADGILFQKLFNLIYDEKLDCKLVASNDPAVRLLNWSRINRKFRNFNSLEVICFNYL